MEPLLAASTFSISLDSSGDEYHPDSKQEGEREGKFSKPVVTSQSLEPQSEPIASPTASPVPSPPLPRGRKLVKATGRAPRRNTASKGKRKQKSTSKKPSASSIPLPSIAADSLTTFARNDGTQFFALYDAKVSRALVKTTVKHLRKINPRSSLGVPRVSAQHYRDSMKEFQSRKAAWLTALG